MNSTLIALAAMSKNRVIGRDGQLPWHLPADLRFFKKTTLGQIVIMGRRTYESIGRPLPGRENVVLSRSADPIEGVRLVRHLSEIPRHTTDGRRIYLIGGGQLYAALLPECAELLLTVLDREVEGDTFFPEFEPLFAEPETIEQGEGYEIRRYIRDGERGR